jgi:hypothetical protein
LAVWIFITELTGEVEDSFGQGGLTDAQMLGGDHRT